MRDFMDEAKKLIGIKSISGEGNEEIANYLFDRFRDLVVAHTSRPTMEASK